LSASDTIVAIATPPGAGALSIVRLSGPRAAELLRALFVPEGPAELEPRRVRHGEVRAAGATIDDGIAWWAPAPATFTGEETAEITGHGGALVTARVLQAFVDAGARPAEPGEFTRRAFLNGRIDLARAEAVADVIGAATDEALRVARAQLSGGLSAKIAAMRDETLDALAHVEATVDFPDEDLHPEGNEAIARRFDAVAVEARALAATFARGRLLREGARVVLAGRPNVGKSSLLNRLAGRDRAIVTAEPGTTRDVIEEPIDLGGVPVLLHDTAGIREGAGEAEAEGVRRSRATAAAADLVLVVYDLSEGFTPEDESIRKEITAPSLLVANKIDLPPIGKAVRDPAAPELRVSATTGAGIDALVAAIHTRLQGDSKGEGLTITRIRHKTALESAAGFLETAAAAARKAVSPDLIASDARRGLDALGEIVGSVTTEDLLGRIFERFCVGK
jgi:tRNA modification GTPase